MARGLVGPKARMSNPLHRSRAKRCAFSGKKERCDRCQLFARGAAVKASLSPRCLKIHLLTTDNVLFEKFVGFYFEAVLSTGRE